MGTEKWLPGVRLLIHCINVIAIEDVPDRNNERRGLRGIPSLLLPTLLFIPSKSKIPYFSGIVNFLSYVCYKL